MRSAFTLIELLIVIAIITVLAIVVVLALNPFELLRQSRDSTRFSDLSTVNLALGIFVTDTAGSNSLGQASTTYISIPDPSATSTVGDQCQGLNLPALAAGWTYQCSSPSNFKKVDGTGWIPVNFTKISSGAPLGNLPADPTNNSSTGFYYTYTTDGTKYELTALMESTKQRSAFALTPSNSLFPGVYEQGTNLTLSGLYNPSALVGYWNFDEGSGSSTPDQSGNGNTGTWNGSSGGTNSTHYVGGKIGKYAGTFDGSTDYVNVGGSPFNFGIGSFSFSFWMQSTAPSVSTYVNPLAKNGGYAFSYKPSTTSLAPYIYDGTTILYFGSSFNMNDGQWHFITVVADRSAQRGILYIDGKWNDQQSIASVGSVNSGSALTIGEDITSGSGTAFSGSIDDVRVYNRVLSAAEAQALYSAGK